MRANRGFVFGQDMPAGRTVLSEYYVRESESGAMHRIVYNGGSHGVVHMTEQSCIDAEVVVRDGVEQVTCTPAGPVHEICQR